MTRPIPIDALLTGTIAPLGPRAAPSGIAKAPVTGPLTLGHVGLEGDVQGDLRVHGGPEKAVHHYPHDHYAAWRAVLGPHPLLDRPGAFGENISTTGITEADVAIGDVFALGAARVQVSQGRQPCWKLNARFDLKDLALQVQKSGRTGWYYRVLEEGLVAPGDAMRCIERPSPQWTVERTWRVLYVNMLDPDELAAMAALPNLAANWQSYAAKRLASRKAEDWGKRLNAPGP
jgi:MOSC domain-containing protein YiiM